MRRMDLAIGAAAHFIESVHRDGFDQGMIATFGETLRIEQDFTTQKENLLASLGKIGRVADHAYHQRAYERSRLYASIHDTIERFWAVADRRRQWLLLVITDGDDTAPGEFHHHPERIARVIKEQFLNEPTNILSVVVVGAPTADAVGTLLRVKELGGRFPVIPVTEILSLEDAVLEAARKFVPPDAVSDTSTWVEVARQRQSIAATFSYAILLDRSGTMLRSL
jgi:hypothetical protein